MPDVDEELANEIAADEYARIRVALDPLQSRDPRTVTLPELQLDDTPSKPFGLGNNSSVATLDFSTLVEMRRAHQTHQAAKCARTKGSKDDTDDLSSSTPHTSIRRDIINQYTAILKEEQDQAVGTGVERKTRWRAPAPGGRDGLVEGADQVDLANGNSSNAAATATALAKKVSLHITCLFHQYSIYGHLDRLPLAEGRYSPRPKSQH